MDGPYAVDKWLDACTEHHSDDTEDDDDDDDNDDLIIEDSMPSMVNKVY